MRNGDGVELNAEFGVDVADGGLSLVLESAGGKVTGSPHSRNHDYVPVLRLLLSRLRNKQAILLSATVVSSRVSGLTEAQRTLVHGPLELAQVADVESLRREITTAQGRIGQAPGATKEGNNRKRIRLRLEVPGYGAGDANRLAADLVNPPDSTANEELAPEIADAVILAERSANHRRQSGQGMRLSHPDRVAIEVHSVALASDYLRNEGYTVKDVGAVKSYDLDATRSDEHLYVEVKGTTSPGEEIILTRKEVELINMEHPDTMLIVVSNIQLDRSGDAPRASGGTLQTTHPWLIERKRLTPISYRYRVG
ncbi:protein NO VEIN domain-containing protein [Actinophytocola sediminis]